MSRFLGLVLLIVGGVLIHYGWEAHESAASAISDTVTGSPTSKSIWLLVLGFTAAAWGLWSVVRRRV
ncbi:MAG TPA: DUF3185 family protein [Opitutus sp.]|nr:DUF3185 family protein [Opitutus sp.]